MNESDDRAELLRQINEEIDKVVASSRGDDEKVAILQHALSLLEANGEEIQ